MAKEQKKGLVRIFNAYRYSMKGFKAGIENEAAIRQELVIAAILTVIAFVLRFATALEFSSLELVVLVAMPWLTVVAELLNSGIEAVVDRIGSEYHELSGRAKDLGSAAVFVMLILTLFTWVALVVEHIVD
ncbi:MAG: diacylglycerol kinase [Succinivibrio sp.]